MVSLRLSGSSDFSVIRDTPVTCVPRPCPLGDEGERVDLVVNGPVVYSYSSAHDHYWFSSAPCEDWFSDYYRTQWGRFGQVQRKSGLREAVKGALGPLLPLARRIKKAFGGDAVDPQREWVERFTQADMQRSFATFSPQLPPGGCIIEVGTGAGHFLWPFVRAGYRARGFEPSPASAVQARASGVDIVGEFAMDDDRTREALSSADMVVSNHSLEHHYDPNRLLALCARYMKPGAVLGIAVPNAETEFLMMTHLFVLHLDAYTPVSLERMLNKHGFRVIDREIGGQLRFVAVRDPALASLEPLKGPNAQDIRAAYHARFLSQLPPDENFSIKGARPFRGINYELCRQGDFGSRTFRLERTEDGGTMIRYHAAAPDQAVLVLK